MNMANTCSKRITLSFSIGPRMGNLALAPSAMARVSRRFHAWPPLPIAAARFLSILAVACILASMSASTAVAQDAAAEEKKKIGNLATAATNPVGSLIQLQLQDQFTPSSENSSGVANAAIIQPVIPFGLGADNYFQGFITRPTIPVVVTTPDPNGPRERTTGTGDIVVVNALTHTDPGEDGEFFTWGPIATFTFPTATQDETGQGKFQAGPGAIVIKNITNLFNEGDSLLTGGFGYQQWSFAGEGSRAKVSQLFFTPVLTYKFSLFGEKGYYAGLPDDVWTYNFERSAFTQIPVGLRFGRVFAIGKRPVNLFLQSWYNAASENSSIYTIKFNFTFLFPK